MTDHPIKRAGNAFLWQAVKMGGVKLIYMLRLLVVARLLLPDDIGLVAIATTAMGFLFNVTSLGMQQALVQGREMDERHYDSAWTLDFLRSLSLTIITIIAAPLIAAIFAEPRAVPIIQVLAIRPLIESLTSIKVAALNRDLTFRPLAVLNIIEALVNTLLVVVLAKLWGVWALVAGAIGGALAVLIASYIFAPYRPRLYLTRDAMRPLIHFGRWIFLTNLIALISNYVLRVVISRQFGSAGLGIFYMASQLAFLPGDVAGEAVGAVAFPLFARLQHDVQQSTRVFRAMFSGLAAVTYPICALLIVLAPALTREVLGPNWAGTEAVIRILALVVLFGIFGEVTVSVFKGLGQPYRITLLEVIQSSTLIALSWILTQRFGLVGAALAWLPAIILSQFLSVWFIVRVLDRPFEGLHRPFAAIGAAMLVCVSAAALVNALIPGLVGFVAAAALGALMTAVLLWMADRQFGLGFARNLAAAFPQIAGLVGHPSLSKK